MCSKRKRHIYYLFTFIGLLTAIIIIRRCSPYEEWKDSNLLVNSLMAAIPTGIFILLDQIIRRHKK